MWKSPVNIYIGGAARGCPNPGLTAPFITAASKDDWTFIPTWVGPQAPCTSFLKRFSADVGQAYLDGINEANLAMEALASLGLTAADKSGSVVYYDLETYANGVNPAACREAVNSFMNGWVTQLHQRGNLAGVYGSTGCKYGLNSFLQIANVPDVIWPAIWDHPAGVGTYDPSATVWNAGCIATTNWASHQRIRQYSGAHNENYGGVTLNIDNDVIDGVVAVPSGTIVTPPSAAFSASPLSGQVPLTVTFNIANTNYITACSWDYGDGEIGASCAASHTHTYTSAGTYTVSLTVSGPGGSDSVIHSNYITATAAPPLSQPDLVPFPRPERSNPVSLASVAGTTTDGTLYAGQPTYLDWGFMNTGNANISTAFKVDLYIDNQLFIDYAFSGFNAGSSAGADDWAVSWNTPGWHWVKLVLDPDNTVIESNENNNVWTAQYYWESNLPTRPLALSPAGLISDTTPDFQWAPLTWILSYVVDMEPLESRRQFLHHQRTHHQLHRFALYISPAVTPRTRGLSIQGGC